MLYTATQMEPNPANTLNEKTESELAEKVLHNIFYPSRRYTPTGFDAAEFLSGVLLNQPGYREAYKLLRTTVVEQFKMNLESSTPEQTLFRHLERFDKNDGLDEIISNEEK